MLSLGAFKFASGSPDQHPLRNNDRRMGGTIARLKCDINGYKPSDSEEKITDVGDKGIAWEHGRRASSKGNHDDLELGTRYPSRDCGTDGQPNASSTMCDAEPEECKMADLAPAKNPSSSRLSRFLELAVLER